MAHLCPVYATIRQVLEGALARGSPLRLHSGNRQEIPSADCGSHQGRLAESLVTGAARTAPPPERTGRRLGVRGRFIVTLVIAAALMMWPLASAAPAADTSLAAGTSGPGAAVPTVGALFTVSDGQLGSHFCTASVVDSPAGDMLVTAAHCLTGYSLTAPAGIAFVPGYSQGATRYGIW